MRASSVDSGTRIQPRLADGFALHAWRLGVTSMLETPERGSGATNAPISSGWTPASPPKLFQVTVASSQDVAASCSSPGVPDEPLKIAIVTLADWTMEPAGTCPGPVP